MFAQESVMEIQKIPTLAEKQEFWAEQLPNFKAKYWLPSHFEYVIFDMEQGNYVIKDDLSPDFEGDATEIWHRVNTGWAMWKKAINFGRKQAQSVPEGFVLVPMVPSERMINAVRQCYEGEAYLPYSLYSEFVNQAIIERMEAQEPTND